MLISFSEAAVEPVDEYIAEFVTHGKCDVVPTVTFPATQRCRRHLASTRITGL